MVCWAECLGGCSSKQSREHIVSQNLFLGDIVRVQGFSWCKQESRDIGIGNLTAKILCDTHNNALSPVDQSAGKAFSDLREMTRLKNVREAMRPRIWTVKRYLLNGVMLERWLLKTLVNIGFDREYAIGGDSDVPGKPSDRLVRVAFGVEQFQNEAGMYAISRVGMKSDLEDRISFMPIIKARRHIVAGVFTFRGVCFLLYLEPEGPQNLRGLSFLDEDLADMRLIFQTPVFRIIVGKHLSQVVEVKRTEKRL